MKVYAVEEQVPYESSDTIAIMSTLGKALELAEKLNSKDDGFADYEVKEFEVDSTEGETKESYDRRITDG